MKKRNRYVVVLLFLIFIVYTILIMNIDVKPIGPNGSFVGLATLNQFVHNLFGVHMNLYILTDVLSMISFVLMFGFALLGLVQLIKRRSLWKVDYNILALGIFYIIVFAFYIFFEFNIINYRPILIEGVLEATYPSSTTMLMMCTIPTAIIQFQYLINSIKLRKRLNITLVIYMFLMVFMRMISGVHWFSDIIGGIILSVALVYLYISINESIKNILPNLNQNYKVSL